MAIALVYHNNPKSDCLSDLKVALFDMSHAGQESHWYALSGGRVIDSEDGQGVVEITEPGGASGYVGVGRNSSKYGAKPAFSHSPKLGDFVLAFDGYLKNGDVLREKYGGKNDGETVARFIADANDFEKGVANLAGEANGHFCLTMTTEGGEAYASRCAAGVRPLVYGEGENGSALVTESRALSHIGMERVRDISPGELVGIDGSGVHTISRLEGKKNICSFLWAYYQWIDCVTEGIEVDMVRSRVGAKLAQADRDSGLFVDISSPVPDSGKGYAEGYALESGCHHSEPLIKYPYAGRSYDRPDQEKRDMIAQVKLNVVPRRARGKKMVLWDDSIRRGTQLIKPTGPIGLLKSAGAEEIHLRIGSPRNIAYCRGSPPDGDRYEDGMLAANRFPSDEEFADYLGVDSVRFIGRDDFVNAIVEGSDLSPEDLCLGCYTGEFGFLE